MVQDDAPTRLLEQASLFTGRRVSTVGSLQPIPSHPQPKVTQEFVTAKCEYFVDVQLWPLHSKIQVEQWLSNFTKPELEYAVHLLNAFMYFNDSMMEHMFAHAFHDLSRTFSIREAPMFRAKAAWRTFLDTVILTRVTGETPNDTDSGFKFARMGRQVLGIPEERILGPAATIQHLIDNSSCPVVFVDDFVGSGNQFADTWIRNLHIPRIGAMSFEVLATVLRNAAFYYCPLVATEKGIDRLRSKLPSVTLNPAHVISHRYDAFAPDSLIWPSHLLPSAKSFLMDVSNRAGYAVTEMRGFQNLGLTLAFEHCVPDATLPIFYSERNGWKPLIRRK